MIGVGHIFENKWVYKTFIAESTDLNGEIKMVNKFLNHINEVKNKFKIKKSHFIHWYNAEPICYNKLQNRVSNAGIELPNIEFVDLYKLFLNTPIVINNCLNFSLKSVAKSLYNHSLIESSWDDSNLCSNGLQAMILAYKSYRENEGKYENNQIMKDITHYNEIDCKVLSDILTYLRENH